VLPAGSVQLPDVPVDPLCDRLPRPARDLGRSHLQKASRIHGGVAGARRFWGDGAEEHIGVEPPPVSSA
jgi:hypothetical protein